MKSKPHRARVPLACFAAAALMSAATPAAATAYTWFGGDGNWMDATKWSPVGVPGLGDLAIVSGADDLWLNVDHAVSSLQMSGFVELAGTGSLRVTDQLLMSSSNSIYLGWSSLTLAGTGVWADATLTMGQNDRFVIQNGARLDITADRLWDGYGSATLHNAGLLRKLVNAQGLPTGESRVVVGFVNEGAVEVQAGTLAMTGPGQYRSGSQVDSGAAGWLDLRSTASFEAGAQLRGNLRISTESSAVSWQSGVDARLRQLVLHNGGRLTLQSGVVASTGSFGINTGSVLTGPGALQVSGLMSSQGGWLQGDVRIVASGGIEMQGGTHKWVGGEIVNHGVAVWRSGHVEAGVRFVNLPGARFDWRSDADWADGSSGAIVNQGTLVKSAGVAGDQSMLRARLENTGRVEIQAGRLYLSDHTFTNQGWVGVWEGASLALSDHGMVNEGVLAGDGLVDVHPNYPLINRGSITPGFSVGTLSLDGGLTQQAGAAIEIELAGADGADLLSIGGSALLDGSLVIRNAGYTPVLGETFRVIDYATRLQGSSFDQVIAQGFGPDVGFTVLYGADHVDIRVSAVPEPDAWALLLAGLGLLGHLARQRRSNTTRSTL